MNPNHTNPKDNTNPNSHAQYKQHDTLQYPQLPNPYPFDPRFMYYPPPNDVSNYPINPPTYPPYPVPYGSVYPQPYLMFPPGIIMPSQGPLLKNFAMIGDIIKKLDNDTTEKGYHESKEHRHSKIKKKEKEIKLGTIVFKPSKGDWQCAFKTCQNWNYAKRQKCNLCGANKDGYKQRRNPNERFIDSNVEPKTQSSSEADWKCVKCGFGNYQYKEECYRCSEPKPHKTNAGQSQPE